METGNALRSEIEKGIANLGLNFSGFSELSGINRGIFSAILNSNPPKPISLHQLELIGKALGQPEGWMFESYIDECFFDGKPNRRRVEPFLIRCAELGKKDCIDQVLSRLLDDLKHVATIFEIGEALYLSGKVQESLPFYECVIQNDRYNHSEKLAISHYRVFRASICEDHEINLRAAIRFESYCEKLPDYHRLDGLMNLIDVYFSLDKWEEAERYARELRMFSEVVYQMEKARINHPHYEALPTEKPLVVYYGYGLMSLGHVMAHQEKFKEAEKYITEYEDLKHFSDLDAKNSKQVERFSFFAKLNRMNIEIMLGNLNILDEYILFLKENPKETLVGILFILQAANKYDFIITSVLESFSKKIENSLQENSYYKKELSIKRYLNIQYESAIYYRNQASFDNAINCTLKAIEIAFKIKDAILFMKLIPLFESMRTSSSEYQQSAYSNLMKEANQNL